MKTIKTVFVTSLIALAVSPSVYAATSATHNYQLSGSGMSTIIGSYTDAGAANAIRLAKMNRDQGGDMKIVLAEINGVHGSGFTARAQAPSITPTLRPHQLPIVVSNQMPMATPSAVPTAYAVPTKAPMATPSAVPTAYAVPNKAPMATPSAVPTAYAVPNKAPMATPISVPMAYAVPNKAPMAIPSAAPTAYAVPNKAPMATPSAVPAAYAVPNKAPMATPSAVPAAYAVPNKAPMATPSAVPTAYAVPQKAPVATPTPTAYAVPNKATQVSPEVAKKDTQVNEVQTTAINRNANATRQNSYNVALNAEQTNANAKGIQENKEAIVDLRASFEQQAKKLNGVMASNQAVTAAHPYLDHGQVSSVGVGIGAAGSEGALSVGYAQRLSSNWVLDGNVATTSAHDTSVGVGASYAW
ncbi:YadA-like family protein [Vibrio kyushuensis]|uniref:YadA C-terminal domain-containing protein n=1 Tax=Vibrio kyushuensis TaxID=2910249 RepID=UPI003D13FDC8